MGNRVSLARGHEPYGSKVFEGRKLKTYLRKNPQDINQLKQYENGHLETFLSVAIRRRRLKDVKFLLSRGADPNVKDILKLLQFDDTRYRICILALNIYQGKRVRLWTAIHEVCLLRGYNKR